MLVQQLEKHVFLEPLIHVVVMEPIILSTMETEYVFVIQATTTFLIAILARKVRNYYTVVLYPLKSMVHSKLIEFQQTSLTYLWQ